MNEPFAVKGVQTSEQVVDETLRAVKRGKTRVITGWANWIGAYAANIAPNSFVTKSIASQLRPRLSKILKKNNE